MKNRIAFDTRGHEWGHGRYPNDWAVRAYRVPALTNEVI